MNVPLSAGEGPRRRKYRQSMAKKGYVIVGLDIGTTKTCAIVAEITDTGIDIIGIGSCPSEGLRKGVVVNIESTVETIKKAVEEDNK